MTPQVELPYVRDEVVSSLRALADPDHQSARWGRAEEGVNYYDDLTLSINFLYDHAQVLPHPEDAVPSVLDATEVSAFRALEDALGPMIDSLGDQPDTAYTGDPRWATVVRAARDALTRMLATDSGNAP